MLRVALLATVGLRRGASVRVVDRCRFAREIVGCKTRGAGVTANEDREVERRTVARFNLSPLAFDARSIAIQTAVANPLFTAGHFDGLDLVSARPAAAVETALSDGKTVVTGLATVFGVGVGIDAQAGTTVRPAQNAFRTIGGAGTAM